MSERPYFSALELMNNQEVLKRALESLKTNYNEEARRRKGLMSTYIIDNKIFPKVVKEANPSNETEENAIEAMLDMFLGIMVKTMGNSDVAFRFIENTILK